MGEQYAQTNLQLYLQLRRSGYSDEDLTRTHRAYEFSLTLFTSMFRASGKPLLAHLVGTASILASLKEPGPVVTAGLLHAAYALGDFGTGRVGITSAKRERVRLAVGTDIEELVARYTRFTWNRRSIPQLLSEATTLQGIDRDVLVIRLANELEDHLDLGVLYCHNAVSRREYILSPLNQSVDLARLLGIPRLAEALETAFSEVLSAELPVSLRNRHGYTFQQAPASHMPRPSVALRRFIDRHPGIGQLARVGRSLMARANGMGRRMAPARWRVTSVERT